MILNSDCGCQFQKGEIYLNMKEYEKAVENIKFVRNWAKDDKRQYQMNYLGHREGYALLKLGNQVEGNKLIEEDLEKAKRAKEFNRADGHDYYLATIYAIRNEPELALQHLKDYEDQVIWLDMFHWIPPLEYSEKDILFENLWDYPEYKEFINAYKEKKAAIRDLLRQLEGTGEID